MPVILRWLLRLAPTNPITVRLVQNGSRRLRHMYIRAAYLGILIIVLLWVLMTSARGDSLSYGQLARAGSLAFAWSAYLQIGLVCLLAPVFMAGAIAQEADPKTWDILLTTPLSAGQIVLGNLFGRLFFVLALLCSSLPLFAVTQYFGGVPGSSIFMSYLISGSAAFLVGSIAIALSVSRLVGRRAVFAFYIAVVTYIGITVAIDQIAFGGAAVSWMTAINPFLALRSLLDPSGYPAAAAGSKTGFARWFLERPVATWCWLAMGLSLVLMAVSTITVRLGGFVAITGTTRSQQTVPWYRKIFGLGAAGSETRDGRAVWHNPIAWREAAARNATFGRIVARWSFIALGGTWALTLIWLFHAGAFGATTFRDSVRYTVIGELAVVTLVAINMAATCISREREDGTLDLLLTTPITASAYLRGKLAGVVAYLLPLIAVPVGTLLLIGLYVAVGGIGRSGGVTVAYTPPGLPPVTVPVVLPEAGFIAALVCVPFAALCTVVGMQWSLKSRGTIGAVMGTFGVIAAVGGTVGLCAIYSGSDIQALGPVLAAMSPASTSYASTNPEAALGKTVDTSGLASARIGLAIGAAAAAGLYTLAVYMLHASMTKSFDMTVRKLAGMR